MRTNRSQVLILVLVLPLATYAQARLPAANPPAAGPPAPLIIRVEGNHVTAEIRGIPLQQVLEELAARTGIIFQIGMQFNPNVSVVLYREELREAVRRVIAPYDSELHYQQDLLGNPVLRYVRVLSRGLKGQNLSLRYIGGGAITKTSEDLIETPEQAVKALAESKSTEIRQKAVEFLSAAKGEVAILSLTQALGDSAPEVQVAAIEALAGLTARSALPAIVALLKDSHPGVRQGAVEAIMLMGDAQNLKDLRPLAKDPDAGVAVAVELAIRRLSDRRP